jgi:hypothetical protein
MNSLLVALAVVILSCGLAADAETRPLSLKSLGKYRSDIALGNLTHWDLRDLFLGRKVDH